MHYMPPTFGQAESADYVSSLYQTDDTHREAPADAQPQQFSYTTPSMDAQALGSIGQTAEMYTQPKAHNGKMSRKEKKALKAEQKAQKRELAARQKASRKKSQSLKAQLKQRDKELSDVMCKTVEKRRKANNAVNWLGYNAMYIDGICEVEEGLFSETIAFEDTSYQSTRDDIQKGIFASLCRLYDQFGADNLVQMSVINTPIPAAEIGSRQFFDPMSQDTEAAAEDAELFNEILNQKLRQGVSNIRRDRYLTFSVMADSADDAVPKLQRLENESQRILNTMNSSSHVLNGTERLAVINSQLNPLQPFFFDYRKDVGTRQGMTTKDAIAPVSLDWRPMGQTDCFKTGGMYGQVLCMKSFGSELSDKALSDIVSLPIPLNATWYAQPMDKSKAINFARQRSAWIDKEVIEEQRSAVNKGYDFSILPYELRHSKEETEDVLRVHGAHLHLCSHQGATGQPGNAHHIHGTPALHRGRLAAVPATPGLELCPAAGPQPYGRLAHVHHSADGHPHAVRHAGTQRRGRQLLRAEPVLFQPRYM